MGKRNRPKDWTKKRSKRAKKEKVGPSKPPNAWIEYYNYRKEQEKNNPIYFKLKEKEFKTYFQKRLKNATDVEKSIPVKDFREKLLSCLTFQDKKYYAFQFKKFQLDICFVWNKHKENEDEVWKRFKSIEIENFKKWRIEKKAYEAREDKKPFRKLLREVLQKLDELDERVEEIEKEQKRLGNMKDSIC